eukprot:jgi/Hompol1/4192/HPOL_006975-RA
MQAVWTNFLSLLGFRKRRANLLCVGLDNSGKSTIMYYLKHGTNELNQSTPIEIVPTIGFTVESFTQHKISFTVFDMSGQGKFRDLWATYFECSDAIVFVVDASDRDRIFVVREEVERMLADPS